jgi:NodT family efflux transporter outer membrane factor (OMF) lipoprotein
MSQRTRLHANGPASRTGRLAGWTLAAVLGALPACRGAPVPIDRVPEVDAPKAFSESGTGAPVNDWWTRFGDPRLDRHVERALESNRELESIWHAFREAAAVARGAGAAQRPMLDLFLDGTTVRSTEGSSVEQTAVGAALAYEVDLWGRLEAGRRAEVLEAWASLDDYHTAMVSLTAEVARTWYRLLEAELQVAVLDDQIVANEKILSLIEPRVAAQQLRSVDLLRQETLIESRREARIEAETDAQVLRNQLAVLTGRPPGGTEADEDPALADLPPLPATGVPIESVRRRPDVKAAAYRVMAGDQELGAALRDRFPRLNLEATAGSAAGIFEGFLTRFAGGLLAPVLDGGRRAAEIDRTLAQRDRLRAEYAQAILVAFREVEDALVTESRERRRLASVNRQLDLAQRSAARLREEYLNGQGGYLDVLAALTNEQELRREVLTTKRRLIEARIGLYRALAGGSLPDAKGRAP